MPEMNDETTSSSNAEVAAGSTDPLGSPSREVGSASQSLGRTAVRAGTWILVGFGGSSVLKLVSSVILTRLIHPEVYGLMDLVTTCLVGLHLFSDLGLAPCVVQSPRGEEPRFLGTAWTMQAIRGVVLTILAACIAWPISTLYHRPILALLLPVVGLTALIGGLNSPSVFVLTRNIRRGHLMVLELVSSVTTLAATVGAVFVMRPELAASVLHSTRTVPPADNSLVWAVAIGGLAGSAIYLALSHLALPGGRSRFLWDVSCAKEIFGFGKWIFLSTLLTYFATQLDRLLVPKLTTFQAAGLYGRALGLAAFCPAVVGAFQGQVVYPIMSRLHQKGRHPREYYRQVHLAVALASAFVVTAALSSAPSAVKVLYPSTYYDVGWILQLASIGVWFQLLRESMRSALLATERRKAFVAPLAVKIVAVAVLVAPCRWAGEKTGVGGLAGMIIGFGLGDLVMYLSVVGLARRSGIIAWQYDVILTVAIGMFAVFSARGGAHIARLFTHGMATGRLLWFVHFLCQGLVAAGLWAASAILLYKLGAFRSLAALSR